MASNRRAELIPAQRRAFMLDHIRKRGAASIQELAQAIGISMSTVRRDLEHLEERGYLERTHGGALIQKQLQSTFEPEAAITAEFDRPQKEAIGRAAAATLHRGESVIFDSSSTVLAAARASVARGMALTAVTNDLGIGQVLATASNIRVVVLGGTVRPGSLTMVGDPGRDFLGNLSADVALLGTHAISGTTLSETSLEAVAMKRAMIAAAKRIVLLADASKFRPAAFCKICEVTEVHELITDARADPRELDRLRDLGVAVTVEPSAAASTAAA
ncbi:DeoR/GlpR family DNA-binding transcription regulator [Chelatococcus sp. GCM10030263]|uniref:DeoR/GlpR family DNA-binding transcription regulator n=1 Tax=Chelatococcus sp. GCM10030263 TaxID=3273387 RepID=UPI003622568E